MLGYLLSLSDATRPPTASSDASCPSPVAAPVPSVHREWSCGSETHASSCLCASSAGMSASCCPQYVPCLTSFESRTLPTHPTHVKRIRHNPFPSPTTLLTHTSTTPWENSIPCKKVLAPFPSTVLVCPAVTRAVDNRPTPIGRTARNQEPEAAMVPAAPGSQQQDLPDRV